MVGETDAPPERLYRPDISVIEWRNLFNEPHPIAEGGSDTLAEAAE